MTPVRSPKRKKVFRKKKADADQDQNKVVVGAYLSAEARDKMKDHASRLRRSMSNLIASILDEWLEAQEE